MLKGKEPAETTLGKMFYTYAFLGAYIGLCRLKEKVDVPNFSLKYCLMIVPRALPIFPIIGLTYLNWKEYDLMTRLILKYALPPLLANVYLFGFSDWVVIRYNKNKII